MHPSLEADRSATSGGPPANRRQRSGTDMIETRDPALRYSFSAQLLHWSSVLLVAIAWLLGNFADDLPKGSVRELGKLMHLTAGQLIVALLLARLVWRAIDPPPSVEATPLGLWADRGGRIVHLILYA